MVNRASKSKHLKITKERLLYLINHNIIITKDQLDLLRFLPTQIFEAVCIYNYIKSNNFIEQDVYLCDVRFFEVVERLRDNRLVMFEELRPLREVLENARKAEKVIEIDNNLMEEWDKTARIRIKHRLTEKIHELAEFDDVMMAELYQTASTIAKTLVKQKGYREQKSKLFNIKYIPMLDDKNFNPFKEYNLFKAKAEVDRYNNKQKLEKAIEKLKEEVPITTSGLLDDLLSSI